MWVFRDAQNRNWRFCTRGPAKCGLIYPTKLNSDGIAKVVASLRALRAVAAPHKIIAELVI
ncbi:MAG: hypothetical protein A2751_01390 [Candidatus Doudnabacteria bacterium RIFCSPHIGHO2_01_FULL_46_14]|uniref:Uncharacterized protein n=1 Tax=Candidatus Doudnabacteria bacterium RIFCSPHIGHO2_01_FULL_46_14 TaxID=1817824 RepID=A0A1F5NN78_9BACT|nr:MAG: hypothetical protein A2751_01390 [Candidatus Doudnabacteria bacterium RIFCSPHIGHO2_01_FULL_46_14]